MRDVIYNNIRLNEYLIIKDVSESLLPDISNVSLKLNNSIGAKFIKQELGVRVFNIPVEIIADSISERQELIDILAPIFYVNKEQELIIDNNRKYNVVLDGSTDINNLMYDSEFTLIFVAHNPIAYGIEVEVDFKTGVKLSNNGNYKSDGVITMFATSNVVRVQLKDGDPYDYIHVEGVKSGDLVNINMVDEVVKVNGVNYMKKTDPFGNFFSVPPGEFEIELWGANKAYLKFNERWI